MGWEQTFFTKSHNKHFIHNSSPFPANYVTVCPLIWRMTKDTETLPVDCYPVWFNQAWCFRISHISPTFEQIIEYNIPLLLTYMYRLLCTTSTNSHTLNMTNTVLYKGNKFSQGGTGDWLLNGEVVTDILHLGVITNWSGIMITCLH